MTPWLAVCLVTFATAAGAASVAARLCARRNLRRGHVDRPSARKTQARPVPYGGGRALLLGFWTPVLAGVGWTLAARAVTFLPAPPEPLPQALGVTIVPLLAIAFGSHLMLAIGRWDDARDLPIPLRAGAQILAAVVAALLGVRATLFLEHEILHVLITVIWLVFVTNAVNFIDNMDGLLSGCGLASGLGIGAIALLDGQVLVAALAFSLAGAFLGVLAWNRPPARIYLGDEGSQFAGFALAALALLVSFKSESAAPGFDVRPLVLPVLVLLVPVADGLFVCVHRLRRGVPPWTAGLDHLSHRLARRLGRPRAAAVLVLAAFLAAATAVLLAAPHAGLAAGALAMLGLACGAAIAWTGAT